MRGFWDWSGKKLAEFHGPHVNGFVSSAVFSPDGAQLAASGQDGAVRLWDVKSGSCSKTEPKKSQLRDGSFLLTDSEGGEIVRLWNWAGAQLAQAKTAGGQIEGISLNAKGNVFATKEPADGGNSIVRVWGWDGRPHAQFTAIVDEVVFRPGGEQQLATSGSGAAQLWDASGQLLATFTADPGYAVSMSFSPDGRLLAVAGLHGVIKVWDVDSREQIAEFRPGVVGQVKQLSFSADGKLIGIVSNNGVATFWRVESLDELTRRGCSWVRGYLERAPQADDDAKHACDGVGGSAN